LDDIILSSKDPGELGDELLAGLRRAAQRSRLVFSAEKTQGPAPTIKVFNIDLCRGSMRIEQERMTEFMEALKSSASSLQRVGILGYIGSVNSDQALEAEQVG
jgi:hypothetical protein